MALLESRGLRITDRATALEYLERIGYYRLSGYWYAFRERSGELVLLDDKGKKPKNLKSTTIALDHFKVGATFKNAVELYVFDKRLRLLVMDALERIEVALRVDMSHILGKLDPFAYLKPELLFSDFCYKLDARTGVTEHHSWLAKHAQLISRSKEEFVKHNKAKYGLPLPIWVACEVWDFGTLSTLFSGMREQEQDAISAIYGVANGRVFASWLRSLNYLRNVCAHHSRLWNRNIIDQPKLPSASELPWVADFTNNNHALARCFLLLKICKHLLAVINPSSTWPAKMKAQLLDFPDLTHIGLDLRGMGVTDDWVTKW
jgi:abortive infection bacteriophage resistance protein